MEDDLTDGGVRNDLYTHNLRPNRKKNVIVWNDQTFARCIEIGLSKITLSKLAVNEAWIHYDTSQWLNNLLFIRRFYSESLILIDNNKYLFASRHSH